MDVQVRPSHVEATKELLRGLETPLPPFGDSHLGPTVALITFAIAFTFCGAYSSLFADDKKPDSTTAEPAEPKPAKELTTEEKAALA